jgi:thiol-disulfide isomerase/thioredoxin
MLVEQALYGGGGREAGLPVGSELPALDVELLDGGPRPLRELVAGPTALLFWNPDCGFCRAMHDDVVAWEASPPPGAPGLIVVSAGAADDVRGEGFSSTVVLDLDWAVSTSLGASGTPMAVLVDEEGRIASAPAVGAPAVLGLLVPSVPALAD